MASYRKALGTRAIIIAISDCLFDPENIKEGMRMLGNNEIKLIQVLDPSERRLAIDGDVKLRDLETSELIHTYISPKLKSEYLRKLEAHTHELEKASVALRSGFHVVTTDTPIFDAFYEILK